MDPRPSPPGPASLVTFSANHSKITTWRGHTDDSAHAQASRRGASGAWAVSAPCPALSAHTAHPRISKLQEWPAPRQRPDNCASPSVETKVAEAALHPGPQRPGVQQDRHFRPSLCPWQEGRAEPGPQQ